ncbi:serine protease [Planosporangium thailandense]|uniref:Serine protease n=1 Tax=Planosporangium thailandense TaxID=765197 RepID=A0ABX0Y8I3_9ACTN|nr:serine protease [Planosporangium thailandense]NJC73579.1 serine protease [Planosporangium thailandense]
MPSRRMLAAIIGAAALAVIPVGVASAGTNGTGAVQTFIVGGKKAPQTFSFMGSLQNRQGDHMCGTTLISAEWAVTAGHCALDDDNQPVDPALMKVRFGSNDRSTGGELVGVSDAVVNPAFVSDGTHDIALLHLNRPVSLAPARIATSSPRPGTTVRLLGWGQTCPQPGCQQDAPRLLQQLDRRVLTSAKCRAGFDPSFELCISGTPARTACFGDSGGPALVNDGSGLALVGATSRGGNDNPVCGTGNAIYTDVTAFRDFIDQVTGGEGSGQGPDRGSDGYPGRAGTGSSTTGS